MINKSYVENYERCVKEYEKMTGYDTVDNYEEIPEEKVAIQDARFIIPHGVCQNIWASYSLKALIDVCSARLCTTMQWEINTVFRQIRDEVLKKFPLLGSMLHSNCYNKGGCKSLTPYYSVGAVNNGCQVYYPYEGKLCGEAGLFTKEEIDKMIRYEIQNQL